MNKNKNTTFLERIVNIDFKEIYTPKARVICHISMWSFFALLLIFNFYFGYQFTLLSSVMLAARMTICNIAIFYLFFYVVVPYTLNRNYILYFVLSLPVLIVVWMLINYSFYVILYESQVNIDYGILDDLIQKNHHKSLPEILSLKNIFAHLVEILMALAPFFFIKLVFDLTKLYSKSLKYISRIETLNVEKLKMENKFLLTQLNPHFLFNTLNNIYALSVKKDDITPNVILQLSDIMRYTLYDVDADFIPLSKEIKFIENYFEMEKMRYSSKYTIEKEIKIESQSSLKIAPLIFFVFIENAFKYGLKSDNPFLKIIFENVDNNLYFAVTNDKSPTKESVINQIGGIGIENAKRRLELIYPNKHNLEITSNDKEFIVKLNILLNE